MYIKYRTLIGKEACLITKKIEYLSLNGETRAIFTCNDTWSKVFVPIEDLISVTEWPDLPKLAFIPESVWQTIKDNPKIKDKDIRWFKDELYCWADDIQFLQKFLSELNLEDEIIINELPLGY